MKISDIINETTGAGSIATVAQPMGKTVKRKGPVDEMGVGGVAGVVAPQPKKKRKKVSEEYKTQIEKEQVRELLETKCSDAYKAYQDGRILFKGFGSGRAFILNPTLADHGAQNTNNTHYNIIRTLPEWNHIPSRLRCVDMTTSARYAEQYGSSVYVCFPFNGTVYANVQDDDFFEVTSPNVARMNNKLRDKVIEFTDDYDYPLINKLLSPEDTKKAVAELMENDYIQPHLEEYIEEFRDAANRVTVGKEVPNGRNTLGGYEVWVSNKVLAVNYKLLDQYLS